MLDQLIFHNFSSIMKSRQILYCKFNTLIPIKIRIKYISFLDNKFLRLPIHPAIEIAGKLISHKNGKRPFHSFFLEIFKSKGIIEKCFKPCLIPYHCIHRRYKPNLTWAIRRFPAQKMHFGRMDVIIFTSNFIRKLRYLIFRFQFPENRQNISSLITEYMGNMNRICYPILLPAFRQ